MLSILFLAGILSCLLIAILNPPKWIIENNAIKTWNKVNIVSFVASLISFLFVFIFGLNAYTIFVFTGIGFLVYIFILSIYTDFKFRYVDRRILNIFIFLSLFLAIISIFSNGIILDEPNLILYIVLILMTFSTIFIPIFGASDGRVLALGTILLYPISELKYYMIALIIMMILVTIYAGYSKITQYLQHKKKKKVSIPAVPFFAFSFLITILFSFLQIA